jgi:hypothetical protein
MIVKDDETCVRSHVIIQIGPKNADERRPLARVEREGPALQS